MRDLEESVKNALQFLSQSNDSLSFLNSSTNTPPHIPPLMLSNPKSSFVEAQPQLRFDKSIGNPKFIHTHSFQPSRHETPETDNPRQNFYKTSAGRDTESFGDESQIHNSPREASILTSSHPILPTLANSTFVSSVKAFETKPTIKVMPSARDNPLCHSRTFQVGDSSLNNSRTLQVGEDENGDRILMKKPSILSTHNSSKQLQIPIPFPKDGAMSSSKRSVYHGSPDRKPGRDRDSTNMQIQLKRLSESEIQLGRGKSEMEALEAPHFSNRKSTSASDHDKNYFFVALFSEPLVYLRKTGRDQRNPEEYSPVDFEGELSAIFSEFLYHPSFSFNVCSLNMENFRTTLENSPEIVHIMCHGDIDKLSDRFYLDFESDNAEVFPCYREIVQQFLAEKPLGHTVVVFLNACYSEQLVDLLLESSQARCIICVEKHSKIDDSVSSDFSRLFYRYLLNGYEIAKAFDHTVNELTAQYDQDKEAHFSFCSHLHKPDCKWNDAEHRGLLQMMRRCDCPNKHKNRHISTCISVYNFQFAFWSEEMGESTMLDEEITLCCCSPELPHEELKKFKIYFRDEKDGAKTLKASVVDAPSKKARSNYQYFNNFKLEKKFFNVQSLGFGYYLYQLFNFFVNEKRNTVAVVGKVGCGKTTLVKQFANYCWNRNKFQFLYYRDFLQINAIEEFVAKIRMYLDVKPRGPYRYRKMYKTLVILDNMDLLLEKNVDKISKEIKSFIQNHNLYFLITCQQNKFLAQTLEVKEVTVQPLSYYTSAKLFFQKCKKDLPSEYQSFKALLDYEDFQQIQNLMVLYPGNVISLANQITTETFNLEGLSKIINGNNLHIKAQNSSSSTNFNEQSVEEMLNEYEFLTFFAFFSEGLFLVEDLGEYFFLNETMEISKFSHFLKENAQVLDSPEETEQVFDFASKLATEDKSQKDYFACFETLKIFFVEQFSEKNEESFKFQTLNFVKSQLKYNRSVVLVRSSAIRSLLNKKFSRKVFATFQSVLIFCNRKLDCMITQAKEDFFISEDTYFTGLNIPSPVRFFNPHLVDQPGNVKSHMRSYAKIHIGNIRSIFDDSLLMSNYFKNVKIEDGQQNDILVPFENFVIKYFSVCELAVIDDEYFDLETDFKTILRVIKMDDELSDRLTKLYLTINLFGLNAMLKKRFLKKYPHDFENRINSKTNLIKSIFRDPFVKNSDEEFRMNRIEFTFLKLKSVKMISKNKQGSSKKKMSKRDKTYTKLYTKLEASINFLVSQSNYELMIKCLYVFIKDHYYASDLDPWLVQLVESALGMISEHSNRVLMVKIYIELSGVYHTWGDMETVELYISKAKAIKDRLKHEGLEKRLQKSIAYFKDEKPGTRFQLAFFASRYAPEEERDSEDVEVIGPEKIKDVVLESMVLKGPQKFNFQFKPLTLESLQILFSKKINYQIVCLNVNYVNPEEIYLDVKDSDETHTLNYTEFMKMVNESRAKIDILIIMNQIDHPYFLNQLCLKIPYIIHIGKYELENLIAEGGARRVFNMVLTNFIKEFVPRVMQQRERNVVDIFTESLDSTYELLGSILAQARESDSDEEGEENFEPVVEEDANEILEQLRENFELKIVWDNETPFFTRLFEIICDDAFIVQINSVDDFGSKFFFSDHARYPSEEVSNQKRVYKDCQDMTNAEDLRDWLTKGLKSYKALTKKTKKPSKKLERVRSVSDELEAIILYNIMFPLEGSFDNKVLRLLISLKVSLVVFSHDEDLNLDSPHVFTERQVSLPKQDFHVLLLGQWKNKTAEADHVMKIIRDLISQYNFIPQERTSKPVGLLQSLPDEIDMQERYSEETSEIA